MTEIKFSGVKRRSIKDKIVFGLVCFFAFLSMIPLFLIIWDVITKGYKNFNLRFFTQVAPSSMDALLAKMSVDPIPGGILNGITGTILIVGMAILLTVPLGLFVGIYLSEHAEILEPLHPAA